MTHTQEGGKGGEVSEILFFSAKSKRRPSLIYSMQIIPVCLSIVARRKGVSATRRGGLNWTPISLLVGHPCKLFHSEKPTPKCKSDQKPMKRKRGRLRKGEERPPKDKTRFERQAAGDMTLEQMLDDLPKDCDRGAKVNAQGFRNAWIGYKLHIDAIDNGIPVVCILTSASVHDSQVAIPLAEMTAQQITYLYECMDSAYDAAQIHNHSRKNGRVSIIDTNPRRNKDLKESLAKERKASNSAGFIHPTDQRYEVRTVVERVNGRLKDDFGARHLRVRGHKKVYAHLMFGVLALCVDQIVRLLN